MRKPLILPESHPALISLSCGSDKVREHGVRKVFGGARVTRKRLRWVAVQVIVVSALAIVVVLTLLKPESHSPLSGITGGAPSTVAQTPGGGTPGGTHGTGNGGGHGNGHGGAGSGNGSVHGGPGHGGPGAPTGVATTSAGGSPTLTTPTTSEPSVTRPGDASGGVTPTADQYEDTLSRLDGALD
jgi:hypothetical protein